MPDVTGPGGWATASGEKILADIRKAMAKIRDWTPPDPVLSPQAADATNEVLGRPKGTPITTPDLHRAIDVIYQRATPEQRERMLEASLAASWGAPW